MERRDLIRLKGRGRKAGFMFLDAKTRSIQSQTVSVLLKQRSNQSEYPWMRCEALFDVAPLNAARCKGVFGSQSWRVGAVQFDQIITDANVHRREARHIHEAGNMLCLHRYLEGGVTGRTVDAPFTISTGTICIRDTARSFEGIQTPAVFQSVSIPYDNVGVEPDDRPALVQFFEGSTMAKVLHAEMDFYYESLKSGVDEMNRLRLNRLMSFVRVTYSGGQTKRDVRAEARDALGDEIRRFIEANLASSNLSTIAILREFGVSRASLYRIFEAEGGVRRYINNRRLCRAVSQIAEDPLTRGSITKAATEWGFSSDANFNRAVRREFGVSPSSLFERPVQLEGSGPPAMESPRSQAWRKLNAKSCETEKTLA